MKEEDTSQSNPFLERIGPRDLGDAVEEAREIVDFTAQQVREARSVVESVQTPMLRGLVGYFIILGTIQTLIVAFHPFRAWYMYLVFVMVQFIYLLLYVKAYVDGRRIAGAILLLGNACLALFAMVILEDQIAGRIVWYGGETLFRESLSALWAPVAMQGIFIVLLVLHFFVLGSRRKE